MWQKLQYLRYQAPKCSRSNVSTSGYWQLSTDGLKIAKELPLKWHWKQSESNVRMSRLMLTVLKQWKMTRSQGMWTASSSKNATPHRHLDNFDPHQTSHLQSCVIGDCIPSHCYNDLLLYQFRNKHLLFRHAYKWT